MTWPALVRAEVKFSTASSVALSERELAPLEPPDVTGIVAVLLANPDIARGEWFLVRQQDIKRRDVERASITADKLRSYAQQPDSLVPMRRHVDVHWRRFLSAFLSDLQKGQDHLKALLERNHKASRIATLLPTDDVLDLEHRENLAVLSEDPKKMGKAVQLLLAYVIAHAGYRSVSVNPTGVPDFELSAFGED